MSLRQKRYATFGSNNPERRCYGSSIGGFLSPDWSAIPVAMPYADLMNPQNWPHALDRWPSSYFGIAYSL